MNDISGENIQTIDTRTDDNNNPSSEVITNEMERAFIKDHRSLLIELYELSWDKLNIYDSIKQSICEEYRKLINEPYKDTPIQRYRMSVVEAKMRIYQEELEKIRNDTNDYNCHVSQAIMDCNIKLGWDVDELSNNPDESYDTDRSVDNEDESDAEEASDIEIVTNQNEDSIENMTSQNLKELGDELTNEYKVYTLDNLHEKYGFDTPFDEECESPDSVC